MITVPDVCLAGQREDMGAEVSERLVNDFLRARVILHSLARSQHQTLEQTSRVQAQVSAL